MTSFEEKKDSRNTVLMCFMTNVHALLPAALPTHLHEPQEHQRVHVQLRGGGHGRGGGRGQQTGQQEGAFGAETSVAFGEGHRRNERAHPDGAVDHRQLTGGVADHGRSAGGLKSKPYSIVIH